jgi:hypothetical protein
MEKKSTTADMPVMTDCLAKAEADGYTENFKVSEKGLSTADEKKFYAPEEVEITNFYRFEGASDPGDNVILYLIKTNDGVKGTLTDAYGTYADPDVTPFIRRVEEVSKKTDS